MARISKYQLNKRKLEKLFYLFFEIVGKNYSQQNFINTINDLLSPVERIMIAKRVAIIYLLMKEIDRRTICTVLNVSSATVAKFNLLRESSRAIVPRLKKMLRNEKISQFLEEIFLTIYSPGNLGVDQRTAWQNKIDFNRRKTEGI